MSFWKTLTALVRTNRQPEKPADAAPPASEVAADNDSPRHETPLTTASPPLPEIRALGPNLGEKLKGVKITHEALTQALNDIQGTALRQYFDNYPPSSLMSSTSRAAMFALIRMLRPKCIAEIGTYRAGGTEVMARALWANGEGVLHTADPYGSDTAASIIATWPAELRDRVQFHPLNSMEFLIRLRQQQAVLDFVLIDGDHDFEPVLFDLQMAAKLLRPSGIIVLNDAVQSGPFQAVRTFLAANPAWTEIGTAVACYDENSPFVGQRVSQADTNFLILQAPDHLSVGAVPRSSGQVAIAYPAVDELVFDALPQATRGTLHYRVILRLFGDGPPKEVKALGRLEIDLDGSPTSIGRALDPPLAIEVPENVESWKCTMEIEFCWQAEQGSAPLALAAFSHTERVHPGQA